MYNCGVKVTSVREFRIKATTYLKATEPVLVTRHGKVAGLYLPLEDPDHLPADLRRELLENLGKYLSLQLEQKGVSEEEILDDFERTRKTRRGR